MEKEITINGTVYVQKSEACAIIHIIHKIVPEILLDEWNSYVDMRNRIKKPLTDRAAQMALDKLEKLYPKDHDKQKACLNQSTFNCWQGLFEIKEASEG